MNNHHRFLLLRVATVAPRPVRREHQISTQSFLLAEVAPAAPRMLKGKLTTRNRLLLLAKVAPVALRPARKGILAKETTQSS